MANGLDSLAVNNLRGEGAFDEHGHFNPKNNHRIRLPWTTKQITAIYAKFKPEYGTAMDN